jgi:hypothetical protein
VIVEGPAAETGRGDARAGLSLELDCALAILRVFSVTRVTPLLEPGSSMQRQHQVRAKVCFLPLSPGLVLPGDPAARGDVWM